jgi:DNA-binding MarR family transcriptional regulator
MQPAILTTCCQLCSTMCMRNDISECFTQFTKALFAANNMVLKHGDLVTSKHQQTSARWRILGNIEPCPLTVSQIAKLTGYTRQSIQRLADALVDEGLATYESAIDRRTKNVCITEKGRELLEKLADDENEWVARITQTLSVEELTDLTLALEKVRAVLAEDYAYRRQRQKQETKEISYAQE